MKNITLSADEFLISEARQKAMSEGTTLNAQFRVWLENYVQRRRRGDEFVALIEEITSYTSLGGRKFTREELNER